jgi:hypothetical protein
MLKNLWCIAAATFLCMSGAIAQSGPGDNRDAGRMQCFAVLVIAASGAKKPDQRFFEKPEYLEMVANCNASPDSCRQTVEGIKEKQWPMPPGLSCGG